MLQPLRQFQPVASPRLRLQMVRAGVPLLALVALAYGSAHAQERVRGRVVSASDASPVPTAQVIVGGSTQGTLTDDKGEYRLDLPPGARTLVFRAIGYKTLEVAIEGRTVIDVSLEPGPLTLQAHVVVGDLTPPRRDVTDASSWGTRAPVGSPAVGTVA